LDEIGAVAKLFDSGRADSSAPDSLLFRAPFRAMDAGPVTFLAEPADRFPDSYVLLFGVNQPVSPAEIGFDALTLDIATSPRVPLLSPTDPLADISSFTRPATIQSDDVISLALTNQLHVLRASQAATFPGSLSKWDWQHAEWTEPRAPRFSQSLAESLLSSADYWYTPRARDESGSWIELPFQPVPRARAIPLSMSSHAELLRSSGAQLSHGASSLNSESRDATWQGRRSEHHGSGRTRAFLRMNWSAHPPAEYHSRDLVTAQMIDIDHLFRSATEWTLLHGSAGDSDLRQMQRNELFAERLNDARSHSLGEYCAELLRLDIPLRAARSAPVPIEVGTARIEREVAEHSMVPDSSAGPAATDAAPPTPPERAEAGS
jgi:hypothetical protein